MMSHLPKKLLAFSLTLAALLTLTASARSQTTAPVDRAAAAHLFLHNAMADPNKSEMVLGTLRATNDPDLLPLYLAYAQSGDRRYRVFATAALAEFKNDEHAASALIQRVRTDPMMAIRAQALAHLLEAKCLGADQLQEILAVGDENVQCLACRGLVLMGKGALAEQTLEKLTTSKDLTTASLAKMSLLGMGKAERFEELSKIFADPATLADTLEMLLGQIMEEKVTAAIPLAEQVMQGGRSKDLKLLALRVLGDLSPAGPQRMLDAIRSSDDPVYRVVVFRFLAARKDVPLYLSALGQEKDAVGALARFELARAKGPSEAAAAANEAAHAGHPIVLAHLLDRIKLDSADANVSADPYVPLLASIARQAPHNKSISGQEQEVAAWAANILGDIGTPAALEALKDLLDGPMSEHKRASCAGMLKCRNPAAIALVKPLLESPYGEISVTSALALGRQADPAAADSLADIVAGAHRYRPPVAVMAAWFVLKIDKQTAPMVADLAAMVK